MAGSEIAHRYGQALYELAAAEGLTSRVAQDLALLRELWHAERDLLPPFLTHPLIPSAVKEDALARGLGEALHPYTLNLVRLLLEHGRAAVIPHLASQFFRAAEERGDSVYVRVRTAFQLSEEQAESLQIWLAEALDRAVTVEVEEDPGLLAGVEVEVLGRRIDASARGRLQRLMGKLKG